MCKRHQRAVPNEQKVLVFSTNNSSSNIYKISVFGKGKYCFHRPNNKIVKLNITTQIKKAVTVSTGSEFLLTRNNWFFGTDVGVLTIETFLIERKASV